MQSILLATSDQLHYTTKRTMVENEQMSTELTYQVGHVIEVAVR